MNIALMAAFGWLAPGGGYLLQRRYVQFAMSVALVVCATVAGIALHGANLWPQSAELEGLDSFTMGMARAGGVAKLLAGAPYWIGRLFASQTFLSGQTHEYGTTLLMLAGAFNLLALADSLQLRKVAR